MLCVGGYRFSNIKAELSIKSLLTGSELDMNFYSLEAVKMSLRLLRLTRARVPFRVLWLPWRMGTGMSSSTLPVGRNGVWHKQPGLRVELGYHFLQSKLWTARNQPTPLKEVTKESKEGKRQNERRTGRRAQDVNLACSLSGPPGITESSLGYGQDNGPLTPEVSRHC